MGCREGIPGGVPPGPGREDGASTRALATILARVSHEALQGEDLEDTLRRIVRCLRRDLPVAIASIILLDDEGTHFVQEVREGDLDLSRPSRLPWPVTIGVAGRCARTGQAQLVEDVGNDPDYVPGHETVRSEYLVPIRHRDRLHGVLNIESTDRDFFTPYVRTMFDAIADQVAGAIHLARVVAELEVANRQLRMLSSLDGLTGIANRRCFDERLAETWRAMARDGRPVALLLVDADHFKRLNDALDHQRGDECLRGLARICARFAAGGNDLVARYGGEELVLLLPGRDRDEAMVVAERLRAAVEAAGMEHPASPIAPRVTVSIGVCALRPREGEPPALLVAGADSALYAAKAGGRNRVECWERIPE